jgi:hypothetical protein
MRRRCNAASAKCANHSEEKAKTNVYSHTDSTASTGASTSVAALTAHSKVGAAPR